MAKTKRPIESVVPVFSFQRIQRHSNFERHVAECSNCTTATRGHSDNLVVTLCAAGTIMLALYVAAAQAEARARALKEQAP